MKKITPVVCACLSVVLLAAGCSRKEKVEPAPEPETEFVLEDHQDLIQENFLPSVVMAPNAGLNILGRDYRMHRMKTLSRGNVFETVQVNGAVRSINLFDEESEKSETYIHAVHDDVDFWIFSDYVAQNAVPAIVVEAFGGLKFGTIVAEAVQNKEDESGKTTVFYFDKARDKVCSLETDRQKVSTYRDDVEMAAIVEKLKVTTRATPRNELFLKAERLNPSPQMKKILEDQKVEKLSYDYQEVLKSMPGARYIVNVEELNTVDQSKDPFSR